MNNFCKYDDCGQCEIGMNTYCCDCNYYEPREINEWNMERLSQRFKFAIRNNFNYIGLMIKNYENDSSEIIIIKNKDFQEKIKYIKQAYTFELENKGNKKIRIIKMDCHNTINGLAQWLNF